MNNEEYSERLRGKGVKFERIRRITGYLVGTTDRFNTAKRKEERDRVKHGMNIPDNLADNISTEQKAYKTDL